MKPHSGVPSLSPPRPAADATVRVEPGLRLSRISDVGYAVQFNRFYPKSSATRVRTTRGLCTRSTPDRSLNVRRLGESMAPPPRNLDGARVLQHAIVADGAAPTGNTIHRFHPSGVMGPAAALAICQYDGEDGCYLFYCDADWNVSTDTWHESVAAALRQATFEYVGLSFA